LGSVHSRAISTDPLHWPPIASPAARAERQEHRAPDADHVVAGRQADRHRRCAHHDHREDEQLLAAHASPKWPKIAAPIGRADEPQRKTW
jgi:hypothetical protein